METWTISKILDWTTEYFKKYKTEWPHLEAEILLAHALGLKRIELYTNHEKILSEAELARFKKLIQRRSQHEPIAYITGVQPFMSIEFFVDRSVLIPRPETEQLVEATIDILKSSPARVEGASAPLIADIGTGCGAIAISLAKYLPNVTVIGIDSSPSAIQIAQKNAEHHKVNDKCEFIIGNMFEPIYGSLKTPATSKNSLKNVEETFRFPYNKFDLIVSNPPYIPNTEIDKLQIDVKDWEPRKALDGGEDGLDYIRQLIKKAPDYLKPRGILLTEFGFDQGAKVKEFAEKIGKYSEVKIIKDLNGKDRILKAETL